MCVCGNYSILNAGNAGETGCLLINEQSRWPRVGVSCECTGEPIRWSAQHGHLGWQTNKTSRAADIRPMSVYVFLSVCMVLLKDSRRIHMCVSDRMWLPGGFNTKSKTGNLFFLISSVSYHHHLPLPYLSLCDHADSS